MTYYCDQKRHLVCKPYSLRGLHDMAEKLGLARCWFHRNHYDMPKRRVAEITNKCTLVSSREILAIIREAQDI